MLALALVVILTMTLFSLSILFLILPRERVPVSVYEMSRIVHGLPLVREKPVIRLHEQDSAPPLSSDRTERLISDMLAAQLKMPASDIRVYLNRGDRDRYDQIAQESALYGKDGAADPFIVGTFTIALKTPDERWRLITRVARSPGSLWNLAGRYGFVLGLLFVLPLSLWFSARLSRPIRAFATSAERLGAGIEEHPVALHGPTEIRMAARSLNEMQSRIARFVRERTSVVGAIAHDLRTPLSRLHFHLASAPAPIRRAAEEEIRQMEQLIGTTLDFVENESRPRTMEPLDLGMLVESLVDDFADMQMDVAIVAPQPITIMGDMLLLKRLFTNLIDNAVKYGGGARVSMRREAGCAIVEIVDDGPGMADDQIVRAFEPFFRGESSRNRKTGGVGLGLSIVQTAAHAHNGTVLLERRVPAGLSARVTLPHMQ
ncbi:sensor histidine kinase [Sphingobium boeckii]|uniref:histidine kinase n=1 Tax=Sphingobium boeckii TaxID=1082345 RepID=A0A7W9AIL8_9SPHN|nr:ATP-binding protein [Sphingobium boeckii]MBB5686362.1 signal transduction histidine kinase [Sphingobium boeckii]